MLFNVTIYFLVLQGLLSEHCGDEQHQGPFRIAEPTRSVPHIFDTKENLMRFYITGRATLYTGYRSNWNSHCYNGGSFLNLKKYRKLNYSRKTKEKPEGKKEDRSPGNQKQSHQCSSGKKETIPGSFGVWKVDSENKKIWKHWVSWQSHTCSSKF